MKKYVVIILVISLILLSAGCSIKKENSDEIKFKEEYEKLNGKITDDKEYKTIEIPTNNGIKYKSAKEIIKILETGTGVIYFGFPECPWCRNALPVLLKAKEEENLEEIYYFNALSIRDTKRKDEAGNIVEDKKGTDEYYKILELLGDKAEVYDGLDDENIKRLYFPTVVFVRDGKILSLHTSTVESQKDPYKNLTKKQTKELKDIYKEGIKEIRKRVCEGDEKC